jgi:DNA-directed RNA polymerase specialized sigma24 family protein
MRNETVSKDFESRMLEYVEMVYSVALRLTADPSKANALARETMLKAWQSREGLEHTDYPKAWLLTTLRDTFVKNYRRPCGAPRPLRMKSICGEALATRAN